MGDGRIKSGHDELGRSRTQQIIEPRLVLVHVRPVRTFPRGRAQAPATPGGLPPKAQPAPGNAQASRTADGSWASGKPAPG